MYMLDVVKTFLGFHVLWICCMQTTICPEVWPLSLRSDCSDKSHHLFSTRRSLPVQYVSSDVLIFNTSLPFRLYPNAELHQQNIYNAQSVGTREVQADSVSDSDSESRNKNEEIIPVNRLTQTACTDPPAPATTIRSRAVKQRKDILCADWRRLSESESEPESACTIRVPYGGKVSKSRLNSRNAW